MQNYKIIAYLLVMKMKIIKILLIIKANKIIIKANKIILKANKIIIKGSFPPLRFQRGAVAKADQ
jgi:hypothetical protein